MSQSLNEIHARLRAADRALALVQGGSTELALVREAAGSLLVAVHELVALWERKDTSSVELPFVPPTDAPVQPTAKARRR